ncbi:hypothetical protein M501DRAFT_989756 [Patellaria atrata CBS 101060]|uniref:UDP N-acetylglucosamine O-acyltransferase C-terminal domain-containing protein n=1 Tax=Patellaria atrata CBS 101060 TaxID=1346257 RepID=A0A9P4SEJ3_9PEZI|nr:hypothetical protein M501DRAFT_989756 [Patellaria atrata CBS 101060]
MSAPTSTLVAPPLIHPTAIIDPSCTLSSSVEIGPFCFLGPNVHIGPGSKLVSSVTVIGSTTIGANCTIWPSAVLGSPAQVRNLGSTGGALVIGDHCIIRECVTIGLSSLGKEKPTRLGNRVYIMTNVHVAHDCVIGDDVTIIHGVGLAGHVTVGRGATIAGLTGVHQNIVIGELAYLAGGAFVGSDVLPFSLVKGNRARTFGVNGVGLVRVGWTEERIKRLAEAVEWLSKDPKNIMEMEQEEDGDIKRVVEFAMESKRGVCLWESVSTKGSRLDL